MPIIVDYIFIYTTVTHI